VAPCWLLSLLLPLFWGGGGCVDWLEDANTPTGLEPLYGWEELLLGVAQDGLVLDMVMSVGDWKNGMLDNAVRTRWCCLCGSCCLREVGLLGDCGW